MKSLNVLIGALFLAFGFLKTESASLQVKMAGKISRREQVVPGFTVKWDVENQKITFDVQVNTTGFVGFGFAKSGTMTGADIVVGGVDDGDNSTYMRDMFSVGFGRLVEDEQQDYKLLSATQVNGTTSLTFSRSLITDDPFDVDIKFEDTYFIWAMGESDNSSYYQSSRGRFGVNILAESRNTMRKPKAVPIQPQQTKRRGIYRLGSILKVLLTYIDYTQEYVVKMLSFENSLNDVITKT